MDFITTKFQKKQQENTREGWGKNHGLEERVQVKTEEARRAKKIGDLVAKEV